MCTCLWTVLVLWYVQMDWLSLVVTSVIKYTAQYCYNKERNINFLSFFYNKKTITLQEDTIAGQKNMYIKQYFNQHYIPSSRFTVQNSNRSAPNKHPIYVSFCGVQNIVWGIRGTVKTWWKNIWKTLLISFKIFS